MLVSFPVLLLLARLSFLASFSSSSSSSLSEMRTEVGASPPVEHLQRLRAPADPLVAASAGPTAQVGTSLAAAA